MKHTFLLLLSACLTFTPIFAQTPANDDCTTPVALGTAPVCTGDIYTTINATASNIGPNNQPSCLSQAPAHDVWFTFVCPNNILDFRIALTTAGGTPIKNPVITVYRGSCTPGGLAELDCIASTLGATEIFLDVEGLTPGATYFIRISDNSPQTAPNPGTFSLCVNEIPPIITIDQTGSTLCSGTLYDSGGPDGNYGPNENHTFTICPDLPSACIDFTLEYYHLDIGSTPSTPGLDVLSFYNGSSINAPLLAQLNGAGGNTSTVGGGGVSLPLQATSGCLTVQFRSNGINHFAGFKGHWQCSEKPCAAAAPLEVETSVLGPDIINAVLAPGTQIDNLKVNCANGAYGTFSFASDNHYLG